jgi:competence ComEA-like helix-hairpin-helix protein
VAIAITLVIVHLACFLAQRQTPVAPLITAAQMQLRLNPNTATAAELELLPRIGPTLARNIVAYRTAADEQPAFRQAEDLDRVSRIGPATVEALRPFLRFPETPELSLP